jgi:hypothetical protein
MKAILNINKASQYAKHNGLTFEVVELLNSMVALNINGATTDFSFNEVIVVDVKKELAEAFNNNKTQDFVKLRNYVVKKGIKGAGAESVYGKAVK